MTDPIYGQDILQESDLTAETSELLTVPSELAGTRLDRYLTEVSAAKLTRAAAVRLIESGCVVMESGEGKGRRTVTPDKNTKLKAGDEVTVTHPEAEEYDVLPEDIPLEVVYEDGDIIVLAGKGHEDYQEIKGVKYHMDERELIADIIKEEHLAD